jgi:acyl-CoA thioesterase FadM
MARVEIKLPDHFEFSTTLDIHISHINRADHLGNDSLISLLNEARCRYLDDKGVVNMLILGSQLINADLAVVYKSEVLYGEQIVIDIQANEFQQYGCDFVYRVSEKKTGRLVALAKTAMLTYDYDHKVLSPAPAGFKAFFQKNG